MRLLKLTVRSGYIKKNKQAGSCPLVYFDRNGK